MAQRRPILHRVLDYSDEAFAALMLMLEVHSLRISGLSLVRCLVLHELGAFHCLLADSFLLPFSASRLSILVSPLGRLPISGSCSPCTFLANATLCIVGKVFGFLRA